MITFEETCEDIPFLQGLEMNLDWTLFREAGYQTFFYKHDDEDPLLGIHLSLVSTGDDAVYVPFS